MSVVGTGKGGRIREQDVRAAAAAIPAPAPEPRATPSVRKMADEIGVDLRTVASSRPSGRITRADLTRGAARHLQSQTREGATVADQPDPARDSRPDERDGTHGGAGHVDDRSGCDRAVGFPRAAEARSGRQQAASVDHRSAGAHLGAGAGRSTGAERAARWRHDHRSTTRRISALRSIPSAGCWRRCCVMPIGSRFTISRRSRPS